MNLFTGNGLPAGVATGQVLISNGVNTAASYSASPILSTSLTVPIIYGSSSASGTIQIVSTSHATKGNILFGNSAFDEVNNRLIIGGTSGTGYSVGLITASNGDGYQGKQGNTAHGILNAFTDSANTDRCYFGMAGASGGIISGSVKGDLCFRGVTQSILFSGNNGSGYGMYISTTNIVFIGGLNTAIGSEVLCVTGNAGSLSMSVYNTNTTAGSYAQTIYGCGSQRGYVLVYNQNTATSGYAAANTMVVDGSGGLNLAASTASATIKFFPGGTVEKARFDGSGNFILKAAGIGFQLQSGTNARAGNATLVGGTVTVSNTTVTANTIVMLTRKTSGGTVGTAITYTLSAGASFTITSDNVLDTSTFTYLLMELN